MSYDISLVDPATQETLHADAPHQMYGGTYAVGGTDELRLNITYNYSRWYYKNYAFGARGIRAIYGLSGAESIPVLKRAICGLESSCEDLSEEDRQHCISCDATGYWMPTKTHAIRPLYQLLAMAQMRPDGIWEGD